MTKRSLGICLGASTIKAVELKNDGDSLSVVGQKVLHHDSNPREVFATLLNSYDLDTFDYAMVTGRKLRTVVNASSITEPEAVEHALAFVQDGKSYTAVASLGAENFVVYPLDPTGHISSVETGNKCASGTGEFFLQQIGRMNITIDEAVDLARGSEIYGVSGRCTVFCKSDCTHALNRGIPIGRVTAGLCEMMADKVLDLLSRVTKRDVVVVGGVTQNSVIVDLLQDQVDGMKVPEYADVFEALGAACYAMKAQSPMDLNPLDLFTHKDPSFDFLPPIEQGKELVRFEKAHEEDAQDGDECIIGLDVGSTTTKAVLIRTGDSAQLASIYLRTNGNPVKASRECYGELSKIVGEKKIKIVGLGTTGSGRKIAGLHAKTDAIINEIIAHATGAAYYDTEVDTIFEIGGQDAKYTHLTNGVPSDYAMNEACSAGTGSFLEEAAKESMGVDFRQIGDVALKAKRPPNFNDQCAAFINSDIKTAVHEGISHVDIVGGLVYSICQNYINRVKGPRLVGQKVFMQGGVCYNKAVPLAMAIMLGKEIVVPPNPGLIGAFGVALEVRDRIQRGALKTDSFDLEDLAAREIEYGKSFKCRGGKENCDLGCEITTMKLGGKRYPFGGACNKYYNQIHHISMEQADFDYVKTRQRMVFQDFAPVQKQLKESKRTTVGMNRTFLTNRFYPLYSTFFEHLDCEVVLSDNVDHEGVKRARAEFCFPAEIAHGCYANLLEKKTDFIFLPKIFSLPVDGGNKDRKFQATCILLMSEAYWLRSAFRDVPNQPKILDPQLDFNEGLDSKENVFAKMAVDLGKTEDEGRRAYHLGIIKQNEYQRELKKMGRTALAKLEADPDKTAVVLFGRPYNAFASEANMAIPSKFASRGITIIPWDALPFEDVSIDPEINWALGQDLLRAAKLVEKHPQLFGAFVTNFSCGPDSFLVGYFRNIMKTKPSLTLELDSHAADAGINTRIEAFWDIVNKYLQVGAKETVPKPHNPAKIEIKNKQVFYVASDDTTMPLTDHRVHLIFPSMGPMSSQIIAAVFSGTGVRATALPVPNHETLKLGRGNTSCKECLPLILVTGGLLQYLKHRKDKDEKLAYFMPTSGGGCRFTQYNVFLKKHMEKHQIDDVAFLSLTNTNGYAGLGIKDQLNVLKGMMIADVMEDIRIALNVLAVDKESAQKIFEVQWQKIVDCFIENRGRGIYDLLVDIAARLAAIPKRFSIKSARKVALNGEMYVRRDHFSCQDIVERLAQRDIIAKRGHIFEYVAYSDYNVANNLWENKSDEMGIGARVEHKIKTTFQRAYEITIKRALSKSQLYEYELLDIPGIVEYGKHFFDPRFTGETIVTVGAFFKEMLHSTHGLISIGPFACMPNRIVEATLSADHSMETKIALDNKHCSNNKSYPKLENTELPFLSIEADGNPFPQIVDARFEAFCLQVERLHQKVGS